MKKKTKGIALGAIAAVAGTAAGAYYLYGSAHAKQHRKKVAGYIGKAKKDIAREVKKLKTEALTMGNYEKIVRAAKARYKDLKNLDPKDLQAFMTMVGTEWKALNLEAARRTKLAKAMAKKVTAKIKKGKKKK